ncbi:PREDICTED: beta-1,4-N-acetylgalactosaminyltransferase bre-4-like [Priapulus caudatus]|uniref:Beta-1,4-N-acetylgalactosaminyltransferase n=1 Tax=Priapulus caudatus TaxID=37621 RepID=A0ABM1F8F8_PRICU|nr:PREDICTED: beta-1,4-N-acetylgalactosaminyltransferase bre-4-like [Priapulus caudatus]XP_014680728.1 PREDICTED: beta-1,4-N-acetylgalactosaminyltransferase bre-4-like [Priapulus caudatus]XP_014680729.1 PREDICTED: beta-1,4-N-acetylgalactosaminyltransferase bre-4-like [Priapulus caudatus]XP_014680730.1 PREDICTED: beta-1,4-N-acetylgalactosaminyltransferase bre-4-like [Priapulus caudatus]XP_014680731.1 PREDICTED: beta-1,4-N-acetylgalactosaminyltransferase bre-4-like [Priapulus caudatus]XP_0146807
MSPRSLCANTKRNQNILKISVFALILLILLQYYVMTTTEHRLRVLAIGLRNGNSLANLNATAGTGSKSSRLKTPPFSVLRENGSSVGTTLPLCPVVSPELIGPIHVIKRGPAPWNWLERNLLVEKGGRYKPEGCTSRHRVAIIVPYRDRDDHLRLFLQNMHPFLMRQQLDYGIYIVEQAGRTAFNRAKLFNIGYAESIKDYDWQCFIFHDVDLVPEDDRNIYSCPDHPRHLSVAIDKFRYSLPYDDIFGGASAISREMFEKVNGFSNVFFGWGGEDDDMSTRLRKHNLIITRYPERFARYRMLSHKAAVKNRERHSILTQNLNHSHKDGINSLDYKLKTKEQRPLYTRVLADVISTKVEDDTRWKDNPRLLQLVKEIGSVDLARAYLSSS